MATIEVKDILRELRIIVSKAQENVEMEDIVQPFLHQIEDYRKNDQVITAMAECLYNSVCVVLPMVAICAT